MTHNSNSYGSEAENSNAKEEDTLRVQVALIHGFGSQKAQNVL